METGIKKVMEMKDNNNNSGLLGFALAGMAIGAAAWYLFGTKEGRNTLNKAVEGINEISTTLKEKANEGLESASELAAKAKRKFEEGKGKFYDAAGQVKDEVESKANRLKDEAEELGRKAGHSSSNLVGDVENKLNN